MSMLHPREMARMVAPSPGCLNSEHMPGLAARGSLQSEASIGLFDLQVANRPLWRARRPAGRGRHVIVTLDAD
jgi:hypothetical protein